MRNISTSRPYHAEIVVLQRVEESRLDWTTVWVLPLGKEIIEDFEGVRLK